ncbi:hypothetical protein HispidOSU_015530 [Sigmodon hispidus]
MSYWLGMLPGKVIREQGQLLKDIHKPLKKKLHLASDPKATEDTKSLPAPGLPRLSKGINTPDHKSLNRPNPESGQSEASRPALPGARNVTWLSVPSSQMPKIKLEGVQFHKGQAICHPTLNSLYHVLHGDTATNSAKSWWLCSLSGTCI